MSADHRLQLHLVLPYKSQPADDPRIRRYLDRGYRIEELQRLTDREAIVVLALRPDPASAPPA
jgi:hypothetical protein